jgi:hypothetical protein
MTTLIHEGLVLGSSRDYWDVPVRWRDDPGVRAVKLSARQCHRRPGEAFESAEAPLTADNKER